MTQFTQKYTIIQLFEGLPEGTQFFWKDWPLHSTVVDVFAIDWGLPTMIEKLTQLLNTHTPATSVVEKDRFFGDQGQVQAAGSQMPHNLQKKAFCHTLPSKITLA